MDFLVQDLSVVVDQVVVEQAAEHHLILMVQQELPTLEVAVGLKEDQEQQLEMVVDLVW